MESGDPKMAVVTGATGGIGRAVTSTLLGDGYRVIAVGRNQIRLTEMREEAGEGMLPVVMDVSDGDCVSKFVQNLPTSWRRIDVLVNNAGHDVGGRRAFHEGTADQWDDIIDTNVKGLMRMTHAVIPAMIERGRGHILNMGSIAGLFTYPGGTAYSASKYAVRAFTEALRKDYAATQLRITEILPGLVKTGFAESRLEGKQDETKAFYEGFLAHLEPNDVANAVLYAIQQPTHVNISQIVIEPTQTGVKES